MEDLLRELLLVVYGIYYATDIDHVDSFWPSVYKSLQKPPCPTLSQADGEADKEERGTTSAGALMVPEISKSKLEEGKCATAWAETSQ